MRDFERSLRHLLGDVVVSPCIQALYSVFNTSTLGEYQNREARFLHPQLAQYADAIELWEIEIENDRFVVTSEGCRQRLLTILERIHGILLAFQTLPDELGQGFNHLLQ
jgi:hypothetical protein